MVIVLVDAWANLGYVSLSEVLLSSTDRTAVTALQ